MKRKIALFICIIMLVTAFLTACVGGGDNGGNGGTGSQGGNNGGTTGDGGNSGGTGNDGGDTGHQHTFSDVWYNDAETHWHPATCEHAETERDSLAAHADADQDGICDVCEYEVGHNHTYSMTWSKDETHHWKEATCLHTEEKLSYSTHSDDNMDGECDLCTGHVHTANEAGFCKYCGEKVKDIENSDLGALIDAILVQSYLVNGGTINYDFVGHSNTSYDFTASRFEQVKYVFGKNNYTYTDVKTYSINGSFDTKIAVTDGEPVVGENGNWWIGDKDTGLSAESNDTPYEGMNGTWLIGGAEAAGTLETWHQLIGEDESFGVVSEDGGELKLDISNADRLNGYYIAISNLAAEYGVENTLYALYQAAIGDTVKDIVIIADENENKITFTYGYKTALVGEHDIVFGDNAGSTIYNINYFDVEVTFTYSDDLALTSLIIKCDAYTSDPGTADGIGFLYDDVDVQYDPETNTITFVEYDHENGVYVPSDRRTPDTYTITVIQTLGDRVAENEHPQSDFVPKKFDTYTTKTDVLDELGDAVDYTLSDKVNGIISIKAGEIVNLYFGNYYPAATSLHYIADQVTIKLYKNGVEVENCSDYENQTAVAMFTYSGDLRSIFMIPKEDGAYKLELYVMGKLQKTYDIIAGVVEEENIQVGANQFAVKVPESYEWCGEVSFTATETGTYYFNLPAGIGFIDADGYDAASKTEATDDTPNPYFDYNNAKNNDGTYNPGSFKLDLEAGQTVRFYVNAIRKGTFVIDWFID